jgi:hypothetical protein
MISNDVLSDLVKKKFSTEYIFEDNYVWINAAQCTIHWFVFYSVPLLI